MQPSIQPRRIARELALLGSGQLSGLQAAGATGKAPDKRLEDILVAAIRAVKEDVHDTLTGAADELQRSHQLLVDSEQILPNQSQEVATWQQRLQQIHQQSQRVVRRGLTVETQTQLQQWAHDLQVTLENAIEYTGRLEQQLYTARQTMYDAATQCQSGINRVGAALTLPEMIMLSQGTEVKTYALQLLTALHQFHGEVDAMLEKNLVTWQLSRLGSVERSILRIALIEMEILKSVPPPVAVNEAVELAKKYGSKETPTFINGVLRRLLESQLIAIEPLPQS